jgi:hypothetical protein
MSEAGFLEARKLFERHFAGKTKVIQLPKLTIDAKRRWDQIPETDRKEILDNVWCSHCRTAVNMQLREGKMSGRSLVLHGMCRKCGGEAARVIEPDE